MILMPATPFKGIGGGMPPAPCPLFRHHYISERYHRDIKVRRVTTSMSGMPRGHSSAITAGMIP